MNTNTPDFEKQANLAKLLRLIKFHRALSGSRASGTPLFNRLVANPVTRFADSSHKGKLLVDAAALGGGYGAGRFGLTDSDDSPLYRNSLGLGLGLAAMPSMWAKGLARGFRSGDSADIIKALMAPLAFKTAIPAAGAISSAVRRASQATENIANNYELASEDTKDTASQLPAVTAKVMDAVDTLKATGENITSTVRGVGSAVSDASSEAAEAVSKYGPLAAVLLGGIPLAAIGTYAAVNRKQLFGQDGKSKKSPFPARKRRSSPKVTIKKPGVYNVFFDENPDEPGLQSKEKDRLVEKTSSLRTLLMYQ